MFLLLGSAQAAAPVNRSDRDAIMAERRAALARKREEQFRAADLDQDRRLTRAELQQSDLPAVLSERFDEIDADGDGGLSPEELQALASRRTQAAVSGAAEGAVH